MRLKTRIFIIIFASLVGLLAIGSLGLYSMRQTMMDERQAQITQLLLFTEAQLKYFHALETNGTMTREEAQSRAKEAIAAHTQGDNFFFIRNLADASFIYHVIPSRVGKQDPGAVGPDGRTALQTTHDELAKSKDNKAFMIAYSPRASGADKKPYPKLIGVVKFEPWGWLPGIGFFIDDIDARFWKASSIFLMVAGAMFALLAVLVFRMRTAILRLLGGEPQDAADSMKKIANGELGIEIQLEKDDESSMMASLKLMQMKLTNLTASIQDNAQTLSEQVRNFDGVSKAYGESRSDEDLSSLNRSVKKLGKTADILGKSISRFRL